ncbi:MAG: FAD-dependent oxidoreductase, partial [Bauldia sp.]
MAEFPQRARVVIVGLGGIVGASLAHHLIERGWDDIVGIDKSGIPTDIGSTAHASDFCYTTSHDFLSCWTTLYSIDFYDRLGHYDRVGGLEVARVGDDARMDEIRRKVASAKAFGTRARLIGPAEIKEKFPLIEESLVQGGLWDPDAGLVVPRSQTVAGKLVDMAEASGKLRAFANTSATSLLIEDGRIRGVVTERGTILADLVVVCAGLWGRLIAEMAGEDLPVMPIDHPLTFFGPYTEFAGTGKEIGFPLLRDQGNSAYMRDTGDPVTSEGGMIEWGYYEETNPRLVHPRDLLEKGEARLSPSQRDLDMEQILEPLERAIALTPILGELGYDERRSFNGLLQVTADGGPSIGESRKVAGLWYAVAIWVKDAPGMAKLVADWMTDGRTGIDHARIDYARFYDHQLDAGFVEGRCGEAACKVYNPAVHPREPYATGRDVRRSPFHEREKELGGYFMELGGWERAHGYAANEHLLEKYGARVPVRENEWDNRHFWRVSNAEHLAMSEDCGIVNLSHFAIYDVEGPDHVALLEWLCAAKIGGDANIGRGIYTHFLDDEGMVRADLTVMRLADRCRVIDGADAGPRDLAYMRRVAGDRGFDVAITDMTEKRVTIGIWGPNARATLQKAVEEPDALLPENFPFATIRPVRIAGKDVDAFRISYVGEQGFELHMAYEDGLAVWDALRATGVMA